MFGWVRESDSVPGGSSMTAAAPTARRRFSRRTRSTPTDDARTSIATAGRSGSRNWRCIHTAAARGEREP